MFQRRTDREEIRRRLAMGSEEEYYTDRPGRKPSLQARLQSGKNFFFVRKEQTQIFVEIKYILMQTELQIHIYKYWILICI